MLDLRGDNGVVVRLRPDLGKHFAEVKGFHVDAVFLHRQLIEPHGLERGGAGADAAEIEAFHAAHHPADRGEFVEVLPEFRRERMYHVRLKHRERHAVLGEHVGDRKLAAVRVAAVGKIHLADLVGIRLHQYRHARVLQRHDRAVLVGKYRHGEYHAVVLPFVLFEPAGVQEAFFPGLDAAVPGKCRVHHNVVVARVGDRFHHIVPGAVDQFAGHEAAVAERQCESEFFVELSHCP